MHSLWLGLVVPIMVFLVWAYPSMRARLIWLICLAVTSLAVVGFLGFDLQQHLAGGGAVGDSFRRLVYKIATMNDFPLFAVWIGSVINIFCCGWMSVLSANSSSPEIVEPEFAQLGSSVEPQ